MSKKGNVSDPWKFNVGETLAEAKNTSIRIQIVSRGPFITDRMKVKDVYLVRSQSGPTLFTIPKEQVDKNYRRIKR